MRLVRYSAIILTAIADAAFSPMGYAQSEHAEHLQRDARGAGEENALTAGQVRRIDRESQKVTIRHGPILNLDMPGMTMVFQVRNEAMLDGLQVGDNIRFAAVRTGGAYIVIQMEVVK